MTDEDRAFRRHLLAVIGERGLERLDRYVASRERETAGAAWLCAGLIAVLVGATWPWLGELVAAVVRAVAAW